MPRIISWNTQGACFKKLSDNSSALLSQTAQNIIMIQEGGADKKSAVNFDHMLKDTNFTGCLFDQPGAKNPRCSTGMLVEKGIIFNDNDKIFTLKGFGKRPIVVCECSCLNKTGIRQDYIFATVHLTSIEKPAEEELIETYQAFEDNYSHDVNWLIMGDMNCDAKIAQKIIPNIAYPPSVTHSKKTLDFAVFSNALRGQINVNLCSDRKGNVPNSSDHYPIFCEF